MKKKLLISIITLFLISSNSIGQERNLPSVKVKDLKGSRINMYRSRDSLFVRKAIDNININYNQLKK